MRCEDGKLVQGAETYHSEMTLVNSDMKGSLPSFVSCVQISSSLGKHFDYSRFVSKSGVMNRSISVFVFNFWVGPVPTQQNANNVQVAILGSGLQGRVP